MTIRWTRPLICTAIGAVSRLSFLAPPAMADDTCLDLMGAPREDARWFLVETRPIPGARDHLLRVLFASSPEFKEQIEGCQQEGLLPDSLFQPASTHTFKFIPDRGAFPLGGRRIRLNIPPGDLPRRNRLPRSEITPRQA